MLRTVSFLIKLLQLFICIIHPIFRQINIITIWNDSIWIDQLTSNLAAPFKRNVRFVSISAGIPDISDISDNCQQRLQQKGGTTEPLMRLAISRLQSGTAIQYGGDDELLPLAIFAND